MQAGCSLSHEALLLISLLRQEREAAKKAYGTLEQQQAAAVAGADNTFEPGEGLPDEAAAGMDTDQAAAEDGTDEAAADGEAAAAPAAGGAKAAPTAEQLTAIKAAVANAQTLEDAWRLEQALKAGDMPSALARREEERQRQQQDGAAAMDEG